MGHSLDSWTLGQSEAPHLAARFDVRRCVGRGGMGVVYEAFDNQRGDLVAVKLMRDFAPTALFRFKNEFRTLADIRHENLVALYELLSENNNWVLTMEFVDGVHFLEYVLPGAGPVASTLPTATMGTFATGMPSETVETKDIPQERQAPVLFRTSVESLRPERLRSALLGLSQGLVELHRHRALHLDIKSSNVLIDRDGRAALCDFGLARRLTARGGGLPQRLAGTVTHMSPEQAASQALTEASDWYGVGVLLYQALTGTLPYDGEQRDILLRKQCNPAEPVLSRNPDAPVDLARLCDRLLAIAPADRPHGQDVLRALGHGQHGAPVSASTLSLSEPAFVGRAEERRRLFDMLGSFPGQSVAVLVDGPSGVGKSALMNRIVSELESEEDTLVFRGRCFEDESVPFKAFDSVIDDLSAWLMTLDAEAVRHLLPRDVVSLSRLFPVLRRVAGIAAAGAPQGELRNPKEARRRGVAALKQLFARLSVRYRVVLAIDDLHWGDRDSGFLLRDLLDPHESVPVSILATFRSDDWDDSEMASALHGSNGELPSARVHELSLSALSAGDAHELAATLLGTTSADPRARSIAREAQGNASLLTELALYVRSGAIPTDIPGQSSLDALLAARLERLPKAAHDILAAIAVAGRPIERSIALRAADVDYEARPSLARLRIDHFTRTLNMRGNEAVAVYHNRVRGAVLANLDDAKIQLWHRQLAEAYESSTNPDPVFLLEHWRGAGDIARAATYAERAADQAAASLAFHRAAQLYALALELGDGDDEQRRQLLWRLGEALGNSGRGAEAAERYVEAAEGAPAAERLELRRRAAEQWLYTGHIEKGFDALTEVLESVNLKLAGSPRRALASLLLRRVKARLRGFGYEQRDPSQVSAEQLRQVDILWSVATGLSMIDTIRGADFQGRHLLRSLDLGEPFRVARSLAMESAYVASAGGRARPRAEAIARDALGLSERVGDQNGVAFARLVQGVGAYLNGDWTKAYERASTAELLFREHGTGAMWELTNSIVYGLSSLAYMGDLPRLRRRMANRVREAEQHGNRFMINWLRSGVSNFLWLAEDDPDGGARQVDIAETQWTYPGFHVQHYFIMWSRCQCDLYRGDGEAAWQRAEEAWRPLRRSLLLRVQYVRLQARHLRGRCALGASASRGGDGRLLRLAAREAKRILAEGMPWGEGLGHSLLAGVEAQRGNIDRALALLEQAAAGYAAANMMLFEGACRHQAERLAGTGVQGRQALERLSVLRPDPFADVIVPGLDSARRSTANRRSLALASATGSTP